MPPKLQGAIVPAITPRSNSKIDLPSLGKLIEFLISSGVDSIFILGTTGESRKMSLAEKLQAIKYSSVCVRNRISLLVGISAHTFDETLALIEESKECGADALVLAPMFGEMESSEQIKKIVEKSSLPIVLYNNPGIHGGSNLPIEIIEEFASDPQIIGIKDSSGDEDYFRKLMELNSDDFGVIQGKEALILQSLQSGAEGFVAGMANIIPETCKKLWIKQDQATMNEVMSIKSKLKSSFPDSITGYKTKLVELGIIESNQLF